jgi:hypothetical protein
MNKLPYIKFRIAQSRLDNNNRYQLAKIRMVEDSASAKLGGEYPKYFQDIICHALSLTHGIHIDGNDRFTYTFPFKL